MKAHVAIAMSVHEEGKRPALSTGISADLDPEQAIVKAVEECAFVMHRVTGMTRRMTPEQIRTYPGASYYDLHTLQRADFLLNSGNTIELATLPNFATGDDDSDLQHCIRCVESSSLDAIVVNLGFPALEEFGFYVYKTIIPGMQPLAVGDFWFLNGKRISSVPKRLGYESLLEKEGALYLHPHPWD